MTPNVPFDISLIFPVLFDAAGLGEMYASLRFLAGNEAFWEHFLVFAGRGEEGVGFRGLETAVLVLEEDECWESGDVLVGFEDVGLGVNCKRGLDSSNGEGEGGGGGGDGDGWEGKSPCRFPYPNVARRVMKSVKPRYVEMVMKEPLGEWQMVWRSDVRRMR